VDADVGAAMHECLFGGFSAEPETDNQYLDISQQSIRQSLPLLLEIDPDQAAKGFRA
jgi:hypothetical protein